VRGTPELEALYRVLAGARWRLARAGLSDDAAAALARLLA
jgi:hypothetical protein